MGILYSSSIYQKIWILQKVWYSIPNKLVFKIENGTDIYTKVVQYIRKYYPNAIVTPGLGTGHYLSCRGVGGWKGKCLWSKTISRATPDRNFFRTLIPDWLGSFRAPLDYYYSESDSESDWWALTLELLKLKDIMKLNRNLDLFIFNIHIKLIDC